MRIAICDDETNIRELIGNMITDVAEYVRLEELQLKEFEDGEELLEEDFFKYDIIFLDVSMKNRNGIEVVKLIRKRQEEKQTDIWGSFPLIIFTTGYPEYMADAIELHAFGYLIKPIQKDEFERIFRKAVQEWEKREEQQKKKVILIKVGNISRTIITDDIRYIESEKRKNIIHLQDEEITYYGLLSELEQELTKDFFRVHKGYLINMKYVEKYDRTQVWMQGGDCLLISKYRYTDFVHAYLKYLR